MAQLTSDNIQITSTSPVGATLATDYGGDNVGHFQEIKINTGGDGVDSLMTNAAPVPIMHTNAAGFGSIPVAGNTSGTLPVQVLITGGASFDVSNVTIGGGTLDKVVGGTLDFVSTVKGFADGATISVASSGLLGITAQITGDVKLAASTNNIGDVDVLTVAIPSTHPSNSTGFTTGFLFAQKSTGSTAVAQQTLPARTFATGFRITNFGPATAFIGCTFDTGITSANNGYALQAFDSLFIEASNSNGIRATCTGTGTADIRIVGT
tara:strand:- start:34666 stop:35463 length:798 start_codon:yes stop_codon:yes gene_type:complete